MNLGSPDDNPSFCLIDQTEVHVLVILLMRTQATVPLHVRDTRIPCEIVDLHIFQEFGKPIGIMGPVFLVDIVGDDRQCAETIESRAPLVTRSHISSEYPVDLNPHHQIFDGLRRQSKPVYPFADEGGDCSKKVPIFFIIRQFIGGACGVYARPYPGVAYRVFYLLPKHVSRRLQLLEAFNIFFKSLQRYASSRPRRSTQALFEKPQGLNFWLFGGRWLQSPSPWIV